LKEAKHSERIYNFFGKGSFGYIEFLTCCRQFCNHSCTTSSHSNQQNSQGREHHPDRRKCILGSNDMYELLIQVESSLSIQQLDFASSPN